MIRQIQRLSDKERRHKHPQAFDRRTKIHAFLKRGWTREEIASELGISKATVRYHALASARNGNIRYNVRRRTALKYAMIELCGGHCIGCGYAKHSCALEFHHIEEPIGKHFNISAKGATPSFARMWQEFEKVILLCRNCHAAVHYANEGSFVFHQRQLRIKKNIKLDKQEVYQKHKDALWNKIY